jgi:hypothetical protein
MKILNEKLHCIFILVHDLQMKHRLFQENNPYFLEKKGMVLKYQPVSQVANKLYYQMLHRGHLRNLTSDRNLTLNFSGDGHRLYLYYLYIWVDVNPTM